MNYKEIASRYIKDNFAEEDRLAVVLIERERHELEQKFVTAEQLASERYLRHLAAANSHGKDVYVSMNTLREGTRNRTKADIKEIKHVYLDLDSGGKPALDRILKTEDMPSPHHVLESSPDKYQVVWKVQAFMPTQAEAMMKDMAREYGADPTVTDVSRVLRVPGYRNHKYSEPHFVRDVSLSRAAGRIYTPSDFPKFEMQRQEPPIATPRFGERHARLDTGIDQSREDYKFAMRQLDIGVDPSIIRANIAAYRSRDGKHSNPQNYAERTVRAAQSQHMRRAIPTASAGNEEDRGGMER